LGGTATNGILFGWLCSTPLPGIERKYLDWLEKGYETKDPSISYISSGDFGSMLRDEPRYQELLRKMNLPVED